MDVLGMKNLVKMHLQDYFVRRKSYVNENEFE